MFNLPIHNIHVGQAIKKRLEELKMTKSDFAKAIGTPQQHINRILERDTMETKKLVKICQVLDFNFFTLFCEAETPVQAFLAAVAMGDGNAQNYIGDATLATQVESLSIKLAAKDEVLKSKEELILSKDEQIQMLKEQIQSLKSNQPHKKEA
ncbi:MAG: helix-turn-helix transcriptional regulator [Bacteroidales bacterium]|nr:helix-turn-helix transcriptional regulator [Bacteroidales bacterium]